MDACVGWLAVCVCCAILGAIVGQRRRSAGAGLLLGLIFGPLGIIVAFALDARPKCPACQERLNPAASLCPHCRTALVWRGGWPMTAESAEKERQQQERARLGAEQRKRDEEEASVRKGQMLLERLKERRAIARMRPEDP